MVSNHHIFRRATLRRLGVQVATLVAVTGLGAGCSDSSGPSQPDLWTLEAVTPTDLTGVVATDISPPPTLRVRDQDGKPIADILVSFHTTGNGAVGNAADRPTSSSSAVRTDANGLASVGRWTLGTEAGPYSLTAASAELTPVVFRAVAAPGPAVMIVRHAGNNQVGLAGGALKPLSVRVADAFDNSIAGVTVKFHVIGGNGSIHIDTATTNAGGVATSGVWTLGAVGVNTVVASTAGARSEPFSAIALSFESVRTWYVLQLVDGQASAARAWSGFIILGSDDVFFAESTFACCNGGSRTYRGSGSYTISGSELVLNVKNGDWLDWALTPGKEQFVRGSIAGEQLMLSWFVEGPDYDTYWTYGEGDVWGWE